MNSSLGLGSSLLREAAYLEKLGFSKEAEQLDNLFEKLNKEEDVPEVTFKSTSLRYANISDSSIMQITVYEATKDTYIKKLISFSSGISKTADRKILNKLSEWVYEAISSVKEIENIETTFGEIRDTQLENMDNLVSAQSTTRILDNTSGSNFWLTCLPKQLGGAIRYASQIELMKFNKDIFEDMILASEEQL